MTHSLVATILLTCWCFAGRNSYGFSLYNNSKGISWWENAGGGGEDLSQGQTQPCQKQFIPFMQK